MTFNRTSVELKLELIAAWATVNVLRAFNRTSVELKHARAACLAALRIMLLIEPVWN